MHHRTWFTGEYNLLCMRNVLHLSINGPLIWYDFMYNFPLICSSASYMLLPSFEWSFISLPYSLTMSECGVCYMDFDVHKYRFCWCMAFVSSKPVDVCAPPNFLSQLRPRFSYLLKYMLLYILWNSLPHEFSQPAASSLHSLSVLQLNLSSCMP